MSKCKFKAGQKVWCVCHGEGVVHTVDSDDSGYCVEVYFNEIRDTYTYDGKLNKDYPVRQLFFSEPKIDALTTPPFEPTLVARDRVLFVHKENGTARVLHVDKETEYAVHATNVVGGFDKDSWRFYKLPEVELVVFEEWGSV